MNAKISALKITICAAFFALFGAAAFFSAPPQTAALPTAANDSLNPQSCAACHQENQAPPHQTVHRKTVRRATVETVRGDFAAEKSFEYAGVKVSASRDGENFFIVIGADIYKVEAVVGVKYIEQYVAEKNGELYSLPVGYNLQEKRWIHLNETDFESKVADFSRHLKNWKTDCAACHASGETNFSDDFRDFGVSCAACHGNAGEHLAAKNSIWAKIGVATESKIVNPRKLSSDASMLVCAQCHARDLSEPPRWAAIADDKYGGETISAHGETAFDADKYWSNGAGKFSGNEYQAIIRSVCYVQSKAGGHGIAGEKINCASCHSAPAANGESSASAVSSNQSCVSCHAQFSDGAAIAEHTKHPLDSAASDCASCHLPETVYGRMRFARTHEISVPDPVLTAEKQIPNACNLCHTDESVNWAIASSKKLWAERFRAAETSPDRRFDQPEAVRALSSGDAFQRALAADSLRKHADPQWSAPFLFEARQIEKNSLVRYFLADSINLNRSNLPEASR